MKHIMAMAGVCCLIFSGTSGAAAPLSTSEHGAPFVAQLEQRYQQYHEAGLAGDVDAWLATRTADIAEQIKAATPPLTGDVLKGVAAYDSDLSGYDFVRVDYAAGVARSLYQQRGDTTYTMLAIMFHDVGGEWKIGHSSEMMCSGDLARDTGACEVQFLDNPRLQLPGQ